MEISKREISEMLDIKDPFLMLDGIKEIIPGVSSRGFLKVSENDWYIKSHIPSSKLMPATLLIEAMLQSSVLILYTMKNFKNEKAFVYNINSKLITNIYPPEKLDIFCQLNSLKRGIAIIQGEIISSKAKICMGTFNYACPHLMPIIKTKKNNIN